MSAQLTEAESVTDAKTAAGQELYRVLCHMPCACDWTPIRTGEVAKSKCSRCRALRAWQEAT